MQIFRGIEPTANISSFKVVNFQKYHSLFVDLHRPLPSCFIRLGLLHMRNIVVRILSWFMETNGFSLMHCDGNEAGLCGQMPSQLEGRQTWYENKINTNYYLNFFQHFARRQSRHALQHYCTLQS